MSMVSNGGFKKGLFQGYGEYRWTDGQVYAGDYKAGIKDGRGLFSFIDGGRYEGAFENGEATGQGSLELADGISYEGEFLNGLFHGRGTLTLSDGSKYEGEFEEGQFLSTVTITLKNGIKEYIDNTNHDINIYNFPWKKNEISSITLIGCGTAYHSCLMAKYWFEELTTLDVNVDIASEFRYRLSLIHI